MVLAVLHDLPWGRLGLTVCYDLRFPEPFRVAAAETDLYAALGLPLADLAEKSRSVRTT